MCVCFLCWLSCLGLFSSIFGPFFGPLSYSFQLYDVPLARLTTFNSFFHSFSFPWTFLQMCCTRKKERKNKERNSSVPLLSTTYPSLESPPPLLRPLIMRSVRGKVEGTKYQIVLSPVKLPAIRFKDTYERGSV